ncbi:MAG: class I SAM-dependent methyltransferase [Chlorobiaceae bacterium]|nr:class I SAM-dependent methyltransferase [Chlorobiaceae bacterium]NTW10664.1 class I SAM-dependent methyltransferase [Chlorobiaceae bacterium]
MAESWNSAGKFNREALQWDENPQRRFLADAAARAVKTAIRPDSGLNALEIGCGTGLVSLEIAPLVKTLTAIDTSPEMLEVLNYKAANTGISNIITFCGDLENYTGTITSNERFDLIYSSMALHHIEDTAACIGALSGLLSPGGSIAIADLEAEDGFFHDDPTEKVHHGFERDKLSALFRQNGLRETSYRTIHVIHKPCREGKKAEYPVFLVTASHSLSGGLLST